MTCFLCIQQNGTTKSTRTLRPPISIPVFSKNPISSYEIAVN